MNKIQFKTVDISGTHFAFQIAPSDLGYTFQDVVDRLHGIAPEVFTTSDDKSTFGIEGTFDGAIFTLYDYKRDHQIHVGSKGEGWGPSKLHSDANFQGEFISHLQYALDNANPIATVLSTSNDFYYC